MQSSHHRLFAKLNSKSGASLLLALLFIMICIMVGAVVLAASSISVERADSGREEEQVYLSMRSAAEMVDDCISTFEYKITTQQIIHSCPATSPHERVVKIEGGDEDGKIITYTPADTEFNLQAGTSVYADTVLGKFISKAVQTIYKNNEENYQIIFLIEEPRVTASGGVNPDHALDVTVFDTVSVKLLMDKAYNITVTISSADHTHSPIILYYPRTLYSNSPLNEQLTDDNKPAGYDGDTFCSISERVFDITDAEWKDQVIKYDHRLLTNIDTYRWETQSVSKAQGVS